MTAPTAEEFKSWLLEALRENKDSRSGVSLSIEDLAASDIPAITVCYVGHGPPPPETTSIGFTVHVTAHRMTRNEAGERLRSVLTSSTKALSGAMILPGNAEYEGVGQLSEITEDAGRKVFTASFHVYLGVET
ncbi:MAG TPA: hypothetical protein VF063_05370 [Gaiellaceae bacterium]